MKVTPEGMAASAAQLAARRDARKAAPASSAGLPRLPKRIVVAGLAVLVLAAGALSWKASTKRAGIDTRLFDALKAKKEGEVDIAVKALEALAVSGNAKAQYHLAMMMGLSYSDGTGRSRPANLQGKMEWLSKAAHLGDVDAQLEYADLLQSGLVFKHDVAGALFWLDKAAEQGNTLAMVKLGTMAANAIGQDKNRLKSLEWFRKAALLGNQEAQFALAEAYENGYVLFSLPKAFAIYMLALDQAERDGLDRRALGAIEALRARVAQGHPDAYANGKEIADRIRAGAPYDF